MLILSTSGPLLSEMKFFLCSYKVATVRPESQILVAVWRFLYQCLCTHRGEEREKKMRQENVCHAEVLSNDRNLFHSAISSSEPRKGTYTPFPYPIGSRNIGLTRNTKLANFIFIEIIPQDFIVVQTDMIGLRGPRC